LKNVKYYLYRLTTKLPEKKYRNLEALPLFLYRLFVKGRKLLIEKFKNMLNIFFIFLSQLNIAEIESNLFSKKKGTFEDFKKL
jgi:hypothetical protein